MPSGVQPAAADTGPTVTSSVAVCAENLLMNGPVSARGLTDRWTTPGYRGLVATSTTACKDM